MMNNGGLYFRYSLFIEIIKIRYFNEINIKMINQIEK